MSFDLKIDSSDISLKDAVEFIVDNRGKTAPTASEGIALIATNCVNNSDLYPQKLNLRYVSQETYETWFRSHPKPGDILLTNKGSQNGAICLVPDPVDFCIAQDMVALRADPKKINPRYLFAALRSDIVQKRIKALNVDAVIPHLKKTDFNKLFIPMPSRSVQDWIGDYYFELSSRIELLRETNTTLEAIAQALFKSWFVDFDPVHAKQQGRIPEGMDETTATLFPDSFEESELGLVPKRWNTCAVYDLAAYINGAAYKAFEPNLERQGLPIIKIAELKSGISTQTAFSDVSMPEKYRIQTKDILFSWSGNPDTSIDTFVWALDEAWLNQHIFRVLPNEATERSFVLQTLKHLRPVFAELARNKQTTGLGHVTVADLKRLQIIKPKKSILEYFDSVVSPIHDEIFNNVQMIQSLANLRDTLLPRLISGQLRLPEIEKLL